jgi:DNA helicase-2/ATP-dependent DNA helicase PcrA
LPENLAIIAAAGSGKTQTIINRVLAEPDQRALIVTYTTQNQLQIEQRLHQTAGCVPGHVRVKGWMSFLLADGARPFQYSVFGQIDRIRGLNFDGKPRDFTKRSNPAYYVDRSGNAYGRNLADLACTSDAKSDGEVIRRLEAIYDRIYVDEVQDLAGYDLDILDLLFKSRIGITVVGDPRQALLATAQVTKNQKYRGDGLLKWLDERKSVCARSDLPESHRCHQTICDFASELFPAFPAIVSRNDDLADHQGVFEIRPTDVHAYVERHRPRILRSRRTDNTLGHPAINIGEAKGSTFDHVLIFTTGTMRTYLRTRDLDAFKSRKHLYVAVTRARHSVALVV